MLKKGKTMEATKKYKFKCLSSNTLKIIAMVTMFIDHFGKALTNQYWMTYVGRLAFPLFAFLIAEGYNHTKDFKKYFKRMLVYALISEIPYNLMFGNVIYLAGQNVLFTFLISLMVIRAIDVSWQKKKWLGIIAGLGATLAGFLLATLLGTDYYGFGVLTVVCFWVFGKVKFGWIGQLLSITYINWKLIAGECFTIMLGSYELWVPYQCIAILSMIPILMYNGKLGYGGKKFQTFAYIFYPAHMAVLGLLMIIISFLQV